uniref:MFS domain-containing protein n=1 Tax=Heterorhabditis bacteriophora TaxID=37862 RepID=A0A1I7X541_HETBA
MACPRGRIVNLLALFGFMSVIINFPEGYTNSYPNTSHKSFVTFINQSIGHRGNCSSLVGQLALLEAVKKPSPDFYIKYSKITTYLGLPIIPALISLIVLIPLKETPKHLLLKSKHKEAARRSVLFYQGGDTDVDMVLSEILKEGSQTIPSSSTFQDMLIVSFWPITYLSTSFLESIFPVNIAQFASLLFILSNFVAAILGLVIIQRIGLGPIAFFITSELVTQQYRSLLQSIVFALNTVMTLIFSSATLPLYTAIGVSNKFKSKSFLQNADFTLVQLQVWVFIPLFIIPNILSLIYLYYKMPETKGREIHQVVDELLGKGQFNVSHSKIKVHYGIPGKCMRNKIDDTQRESITLRTI